MIPAAAATSGDEHQLVAAACAGDDRAFEALYSRYAGRIVAYVGRMVGDHGRAEDISQEVFMSALRRLRQTEQSIAFKPWIYGIAKNACIDEFRCTKRAREVPLGADDGPIVNDRRLIALGSTPDAAVERKQQLQDLRGAFGGLSEIQHKVLVLRELEGLSYNEIGERLDMTRAMVESSLFRARRRLSEEYEELASGRRCQQIQALIDECPSRPLQTFRLRERRQLTRHLSHCQPCRRMALMAGFDEDALRRTSIAAKIAALLPFPLLRWRRSDARPTAAELGAGPKVTALRPLEKVAQVADPAGQLITLGRAAAGVAALAIAGAGGGVVTGLATTPNAAHRAGVPAAPAQVRHRTNSPASQARAGAALRAGRERATARGVARSRTHGGAGAVGRSAHPWSAPGRGSASSGRGGSSSRPPRSAASSPTAGGAGGTPRLPSTASGLPATVASKAGPALSAGGPVAKQAGSVVSTAGSTVTQAGSVVKQAGSAVSQTGTAVAKVGSGVGKIGSAVGNLGSATGNVGAAVSHTPSASTSTAPIPGL